jgi:hypothetical protein
VSVTHYPCERCGAGLTDYDGHEHECEDLAAVSSLEERVDALETQVALLMAAVEALQSGTK